MKLRAGLNRASVARCEASLPCRLEIEAGPTLLVAVFALCLGLAALFSSGCAGCTPTANDSGASEGTGARRPGTSASGGNAGAAAGNSDGAAGGGAGGNVADFNGNSGPSSSPGGTDPSAAAPPDATNPPPDTHDAPPSNTQPPVTPAWRPVGPGISGSGSAAVGALITHEGRLIAGGLFTNAGGQAATNVAAWQAEAWTALGTSLDAEVRALGTFRGQLVAGVSPSIVDAPALVAWDGANWTPFGGATGWSGTIHAIALFHDELWVTGDFTRRASDDLGRLARWDGTTFVPAGSGLRDLAGGNASFAVGLALLATANDLIVAGAFDAVNGVAAGNIAAWDGQSWRALGAGVNAPVLALSEYQGRVVAGGTFSSAGGVGVGGLARWNNGVWESIAGGIDTSGGGFIRALAAHNDDLYVAGFFDAIGGVAANNIGRWDGQGWWPLGEGTASTRMSTAPTVNALLLHDSELIVGGSFDLAGGEPASGIARWRLTP